MVLLLMKVCVDTRSAIWRPPAVGMRRGGQLLHPAGGGGNIGKVVVDLMLFQLPVHPHHHC